MAIDTVQDFVVTVRDNRLLEPEQSDELSQTLQPRFADARALARHLIQQNWLTPYQINQLFQGRADSLLLGSYVILERIGEGGMGQVFKAKHSKLGRVVAIKVIRREHLSHPDAIRRFHREIRAVAKLSHPNVVMAYDADQVGDTHFFVMEYVEGGNLSQLVKYQGVPPIGVACDYVRQIALGLQHAAEHGLVHRDIKPANLLVIKPTNPMPDRPTSLWGSTVKILDMGVARMLQAPDPGDSASALTKEGRVVGTPDYMAPEQAVNSAKADIRADLYSLGCSFYQMLTNQLPFPGGTPMEKLLKHRIEQPKPVEQLRPEVPPAVVAVVRKLMAKKAEDRYQTPGALVEAIDALSRRPAPAPPAPVGYATPQVAAVAAPSVPMALPVEDDVFAFSVGEPGSADVNLAQTTPGMAAASGRSSAARLLTAARQSLNWPMIAGALVIIMLGVVILILAIQSIRPKRSKAEEPPEGPRAVALRELMGHPWNTPETAATLRNDLLHFRMENSGTPEAFDALHNLAKIPSPFDDLKHENLPKDERDRLPAEVVALLGQSRQRHWGPVRCVAFGPGGKFLYSGGDDSQVRVWETDGGRDRPPLSGAAGAILTIAVVVRNNNTLVAAADNQGQLLFWDTAQASPKPRIVRLPFGLSTGAFAFDGQNFAGTSPQGEAFFVPLARLQPGPGPVQPRRDPLPGSKGFGLSFHPSQPILATGGTDCQALLWDLPTAEGKAPTVRLKLGDAKPSADVIAYSPDGKRLACANYGNKTLTVYNVSETPPTEVFTAADINGPTSLAFSADGNMFAAASRDNQLRLWKLNGPQPATPIKVKQGQAHWINGLAFSPVAPILATAGQDTTVRFLDVNGREPKEIDPPLAEPTGMAQAAYVSPQLTSVLVAHDGDQRFRIWSPTTGKSSFVPRNESSRFLAEFAPDGNSFAATVGVAGGLQFWKQSATGDWEKDAAKAVPALNRPIFAISPTGKLLAASSGEGPDVTLFTLSGDKPKKQSVLTGHGGTVTAIAFAPDGKTLAVANSNSSLTTTDSAVHIWDFETPKELKSVPMIHPRTLAFSPKPSPLILLAAGGNQGRGVEFIMLEQTDDGWKDRPVAFRRHLERPVAHASFTPDGESVLLATDDGHVGLYPMAGAAGPRVWPMGGPVHTLNLAVDNRHAVIANINGTVCVLRYHSLPPRGS
jgi:serine/threonine-protein kinase